MEMTPRELKRICRELQLYSTPELNDKIYLHYKGFKRIENLDEYTGLKVIYLEGNGLSKIEGLDKLTQLRCLYLQENQISKIENLSTLTDLDSLNLNQNLLTRVEGLESLTKLNTLLLQSNKLQTLDNLRGLLQAPSVGVLDLSKNEIADPAVLELLQQLPKLKVLYLKDNPVVSAIANYRKRVISALPTLTYLDDRPVFPEERRTCDAWARGGKQAEAEERRRIEREKVEKDERNFQNFERLLAEARGGRVDEGDEEEGQAEADAGKTADEEKAKQAAERDAPPLEDGDDDPVAAAAAASQQEQEEEEEEVDVPIRATSRITISHSGEHKAAPSAMQSHAAINPASMARAAISLAPSSQPSAAAVPAQGKRPLIEVLDDEEPEPAAAAVPAAASKPDQATIQQLD